MRTDSFICDRCGMPLERYRNRYVVRFERIPVVRGADGYGPLDLCDECAYAVRREVERHAKVHG